MQASKSDLSFALSYLTEQEKTELEWSLGPADRDSGLQTFVLSDGEFGVAAPVPVRLLSFSPMLDNLAATMHAKYREFRDA